jgi:hypothetical protein
MFAMNWSGRTCKDRRTSNGHGGSTRSDKVDIHGIHYIFEIKGYLYIEDLPIQCRQYHTLGNVT